MKKIDVFVIDDSAVVREILTTQLPKDRRINVVGTAIDPYIARKKIVGLHVDVIILDIELPRMDGLTFLKYLMKYYPIPVVILSSLADTKNQASMTALELGAVDIVPKPGGPFSVGEVIETLVDKIVAAAEADFRVIKRLADDNREQEVLAAPGKKFLSRIITTRKMIAVGASTGGTTALEMLFKGFEPTFPPTVCVIHMPEHFTNTFARRLNDICPVMVKEAEQNEEARQGCVYVAPGNYHLKVVLDGATRVLKIVKGPAVNNQRPAVDVLFQSVAENVGRNSVGVLLTGMGSDGAAGLLEIKKSGGSTIAQDEQTSIVFGMPKVAIDLGAADCVLPLQQIAGGIRTYL